MQKMNKTPVVEQPDVVLVGSGIMSSTLGVLLKLLEPSLRIQLFEATAGFAQESSDGWNNAGTGHAGICELSYTPTREPDGSVNVWKAIRMFEQFEQSKQFWSYAVANGIVDNPRDFVRQVPHISFVYGKDQVEFLKARYEAMVKHHFFEGMEYATDPRTIAQWAPLLMDGRRNEPVAATKMDQGTDVNFGALSRKLLAWLGQQEGCCVAAGHRVVGLGRKTHGWELKVKVVATGESFATRTKYVFAGAGGGSLRLLQKSGIPEAKGLGGFPIGGQWLVCEKAEVVERHRAKVYGQALGTAPTMAVPHLDSRVLDGSETLLFGPFAAWTTKFLHKSGRWTDLFASVRADNVATLAKIAVHNLPLVRYLIQQGTQTMNDRMELLRSYYPAARAEDWRLIDAGIRVQAIKKTDGEAGIVHYGTEIVSSADRTLSALLGASPGASVSVAIALELIAKDFPHLMDMSKGESRIQAIIPSYDRAVIEAQSAAFFRSIQMKVNENLALG